MFTDVTGGAWGLAPKANRPQRPTAPRSSQCRRTCVRASPAPLAARHADGAGGEAVHGLWCRHQPRGQPLRRPRSAVQPQPAQRPVQHASMAASQRTGAPRLAWRARQLVPGLPAPRSPGCRPDRRSRRTPRCWRCAVRHRQHRRAVSFLQLDEGCIDRPGWGSPCGDADPPRPRRATVCTRPSFANYPGRRSGTRPSWRGGAHVGPRGAVSPVVATHATERGRASGWRPGPEFRLVAAVLSGVALGASLRRHRLGSPLRPRPDRVKRHDGLRLGTASVTSRACVRVFGLTKEQPIYPGRAAGWILVPSLEPTS